MVTTVNCIYLATLCTKKACWKNYLNLNFTSSMLSPTS